MRAFSFLIPMPSELRAKGNPLGCSVRLLSLYPCCALRATRVVARPTRVTPVPVCSLRLACPRVCAVAGAQGTTPGLCPAHKEADQRAVSRAQRSVPEGSEATQGAQQNFLLRTITGWGLPRTNQRMCLLLYTPGACFQLFDPNVQCPALFAVPFAQRALGNPALFAVPLPEGHWATQCPVLFLIPVPSELRDPSALWAKGKGQGQRDRGAERAQQSTSSNLHAVQCLFNQGQKVPGGVPTVRLAPLQGPQGAKRAEQPCQCHFLRLKSQKSGGKGVERFYAPKVRA